MQDLDLLPFVSFYRFPLHTSPFQLFGGWVNGQTLIKEKKCWTSIQAYSHYNIDIYFNYHLQMFIYIVILVAHLIVSLSKVRLSV